MTIMKAKFGTLGITTILLISIFIPGTLACTTLTPGYWKNHLEDWPSSGIVTIESYNYDLTKEDEVDYLMGLLWENPGHWKKEYGKSEQAWLILTHKVIAAQLSMLAFPHPAWSWNWEFGGYSGGMVQMVNDANDLLDDDPLDRGAMIDLAETIDYWLNYWNEHGL
ncbi:hypothetical protein MCGE09_00488 [Thaumarchaeota archaeon SCGC AB-539-E09]|nr:hypothetical protein MCGE09_00488 [Thaumarchaeota archaeon SCGC AB-539-E09]